MGSVNSYNPSIDQTVQIFDQFYDYSVSVPTLEYDAVYSYLRSQFGTAEAAGNFTVTVFRISEESQIPVMDLLQQLQGLNATELTLTLSYYLNNVRSASTLLGVNQPVTPNYYVARNVRA
jgi:pyruvate/2-oxoacid:ferredoxin oxidoreductase alpha subunit